MQHYELVAGDQVSPVLSHVPHSATSIPDWVRDRILLSDDHLAAELGRLTDADTHLLAAAAAADCEVAPWQFRNRLSRLVIDPERFPDEREELNAVGMGAVYLQTSGGGRLRDDDPEHNAELKRRYSRRTRRVWLTPSMRAWPELVAR